ncbi:MAG: class II fructose-bisphosphate aldolase [Verrucomicrobia bacterium]|nr:class II fructose-bisphosphate aldolase [Verrucomicrobiota bacterium]
MFVTKPRLFLAYVFENRFAVPSFNVSNLEMARAVVEAAELEDAPVMVQTDFINFDYGGMDELWALVHTLAEKAPVPVLMHQDHPGKDSNIYRSLRRGYYSVMYDGGHLPLAENIATAARFAEMAHASGAILESEIGLFGGEYQGGQPITAAAHEAAEMAEKSGTDTLAVSVGSVHGQETRLDLGLLHEIAKTTGIPLVLHGGSGIHTDDTKAAAMLNVYKINIGAALINGFVRGLAEAAALPSDHEPRHQQMLRHVIGTLRDIARSRLSSFGASGHGKRLLAGLASAKEDLTGRVRRDQL